MKNYGHLDWKDFEKELLARPDFKEAQKETRLEYEIARALIKARLEKGLTQAEIARRMNTKQSVISRVENARTIPSLAFLKRLAEVLNASLEVQFKF
ncbi:helix-turn-helix transcriptional regulator [Candidatus Microgenomates bacterium]|nr:helix-turn-helix transcriptional regulator [Candidatus Microgenomates bacterium]